MTERMPACYKKEYMPKGLMLRKKCGQIKIQEHYVHDEPMFTIGYTSLSVDRLQHGPVYVPSLECLKTFLPLIYELAKYSRGTTIIFLQSILRTVLRNFSLQQRRKLNDIILKSLNLKSVLFYDEMYSHTFLTRRLAIGERLDVYNTRLVAGATGFLKDRTPVTPVVVLVDGSDPVQQYCKSMSCQMITIDHFVHESLVSCGVVSGSDEYNKVVGMIAAIRVDLDLQREPPPGLGLPTTAARKKTNIYPAHFSRDAIRKGLEDGSLKIGELSLFSHSANEGEILSGTDMGVLVSGAKDINRAMHGDIVVYAMLPQSEWKQIDIDNNVLRFNDEVGVEEEEDETGTRMERSVVPSSKGVPTGRVVAISRRARTDVIATVPYCCDSVTPDMSERTAVPVVAREDVVLCVPLDRRLPLVRLRTRQWGQIQGHRVVLGLGTWPADSKYPNGHFLGSLGASGDWSTEIEALLMKNSIFPRPFSAAALACLPTVPHPHDDNEGPSNTKSKQWRDSEWELPSMEGRRDLRHLRVFSVDPSGCQDIDDAMSVSWVQDGVLEVGIHIADVCAFVKKGSPLDMEAQARSTTIYLVHTRIDMLPSLISSDIASLHGNKDRYAVTSLFHIKVTHRDGTPVLSTEDVLRLDENSDIIFDVPDVPTWAGRSAVHSVAAMTYEQGHNLLVGKHPDAGRTETVPEGQAGRPIPKRLWGDLKRDLNVLTALSRHLYRARERNGALDLSQTEGGQLSFELRKDGFPVANHGHGHLEIHDTIAELMIMTNGAVCKLIHEFIPSSTFARVHPPPCLSRVQEMREITESMGLFGFLDGTTTSEIAAQVRRFTHTIKSNGNYNPSVLNYLTGTIIRSMSEAKYVCGATEEGRFHYGLGLKFYTHFTSPIRRYADVIVHRQLLTVLAYNRSGANCTQVASTKSAPAVDTSVVIPESQCISLVKEAELSAEQDTLHQINYTTAPDGRKIYEKVGVVVSSNEEICMSSALSMPAHEVDSTVMIDSNTLEGDDDFLDDLLGDVGEDLMETVTGVKVNTATSVDVQDCMHEEVSARCPDGSIDENIDDELDLLLGDVSNDLVPQGSSGQFVGNPDDGKDPLDSCSAVVGVSESNKLLDAGNGVVPPYSPAELSRISDHLNRMNRCAKVAQSECQELFLRHYFTLREERHVGIVLSIKENGFIAFVPSIDFKGSVFLKSNDNTVVACSPQVLSLENTCGGEPNTDVSCVGKEGIRTFPNHQCCIIDAGASTCGVKELVVCPSGEDPSSANGKGTLRLKYMQRVVVLVYASIPYNRNVPGYPRICLQLLDTYVEHGKDVDLTTSQPSESQPVKKNIDDKLCVEASQANERSLYRALQSCLSSDVPSSKPESSEDIRIMKAREAKRVQKVLRSVSKRRHDIQGTGRIAFGLESELSTLFRYRIHRTDKCDDAESRTLARALESNRRAERDKQIAAETTLRGKQAAMEYMKIHGEEWAEEEDLPCGYDVGHSDDNTDKLTGLTSSFNLSKETAMASSRINKVKTAKRNSKY